MKKINLLILSFALLGAVLIFSIATTKAVENNATSTDNALVCTLEYAPVCGVDGKTYGNKCAAGSVVIAHEGECKTEKPVKTIEVGGQVLERIPNPEQIKNFRVMKNENGALYGIRIQNSNKTQFSNQSINANDKAKENANANSALNRDQALEKIPNPEQIKNFRVMKNENGTLYGIRIKADNQSQIKTQEQARTQNRVVTADIKACVAAAINAKDEALKTRLTNFNNDISALIDARNSCQNIALESESNQAENLRACSVTFEAKFKELNSLTKENHKNIWTNYQSGMKACLPAKDVEDGKTLLIEDGGSGTLETAISL